MLKRRTSLGAVRVRGVKGRLGFRVSLGQDEIERFMSRWPASGLDGLRNISAGFAPNGDLVELECNRRFGSCERWDGSALKALVDDAQCIGEHRLKIPLSARCAGGDWKRLL